MTTTEIEKLIEDKKFCKTIRCYEDDKLKNLFKEVFYDGIKAGYDLAKYRLELLDGFPFTMADQYLEQNMPAIRETIELCKKYEEAEK